MFRDARQPDAPTAVAAGPLGIAETAAILAEQLADGDLIFAAADDARGEAVAAALAAMVPDATVAFVPGSDALPGEAAPASPANVGMRAAALRRIRQVLSAGGSRIALVTTGEALASRYAPPAAFDAAPPTVRICERLDLRTLHEELVAIGYLPDDRVDEPGEVALRGAVLDVYPADAGAPIRIEVADGEIVALSRYDPLNQRTIEPVEAQELGRVGEPALGADAVPLLDHLPDASLAIEPGAETRRTRLLAIADDVGSRIPHRAARALLSEADWRIAADARPSIHLARAGDPPVRFVEARRPLELFAALARNVVADRGRVVVLGAERDIRFLSRRLGGAAGVAPRAVADWPAVATAKAGSLLTLVCPADRGFARAGIVAVAAADLLGSRAQRTDDRPGQAGDAFAGSGEVGVGDVVVHEDHGIGVVSGLVAIPDGGGEAIRLDYADDGVRLVPVAEADRLWRYGAERDAVTLDRLDGTSWVRRRGAIDAAVAETARALATLSAERDGREAPVLDPPHAAYERLASGFAFTETADQARAIAAVRADLASGRPMERLVIGDVGYGKTEVALRAAAIAALAGRQVALAAPTTVLARQHLETFRARFAGTGVEVAGLSRAGTAAERKAVRAGLADGSIRIAIGTAAVAGKGVAYRDLALVVIDEEQRFGAADKARLRALSAGHALTLTATPIPRTLQSAMVGLQDMSVIATPPARRRPIRTAVAAFSTDTLRAALLREKARGGQSFVVVPRIADMASLADMLAKSVPELEVVQAHGKMPAADLDTAMVRFAGGDGDVLLATNIIEAGLDVPRANTMAIVHADRFGLSQLHQLRGRVGRGNRRGQVLLFTDGDHEIAPRTMKRLRTLEAFDRLGAGFAISASDLDMRGAGDLVGETQAGHMKLIGVDLYQALLHGALRAENGEDADRWRPDLDLGFGGALPAAWIADDDTRIGLYVRLAHVDDAAALTAFEEEIEDRFGELPGAAEDLLSIAALRIAARESGIARIAAGPKAIAIEMRGATSLDAGALGLRESKGRFILDAAIDDPRTRFERVRALVEAAAR